MRLRGLVYYDAGSRSFYLTSKPVHSPADLKGQKIRVQKSQTSVKMIETLGGAATPIAWGELYTALQQGIVSGAENNPPSFHLSRHYETSKYYTLDEHTSVPDILLLSEHVWQKLQPAQRQWLQAAAKASARLRHLAALAVAIFALAVMVAGGVNLVMLTLELEQVSAALGIPMGLVYLALPLSGLLIAFYALGDIVLGEPD